MGLWQRLFGKRPDPAEEADRAAQRYWDDYTRWRDSQTCIGCGEAYRDSKKEWITEYECVPCWMAGIRGRPEDDGARFRNPKLSA